MFSSHNWWLRRRSHVRWIVVMPLAGRICIAMFIGLVLLGLLDRPKALAIRPPTHLRAVAVPPA
jgi:hypothetical protein